MILKTKRLQIIPLDITQLELLCESRAALESAMGLTASGIEDDEHVCAAFKEMLALCKNHPDDYLWYTSMVIILREENKIIGSIGFKGPADDKHSVEVGYGIDEPYQKKGYATEALKRTGEWALSKRGVYFLKAQTEPDNIASQKLLAKCGYKRDGDGDEGPMFSKEKERSVYFMIFFTIGMTIGVTTGIPLDRLPLCLGICISLCLAIGIALDIVDKKKRK